MLTAPHVPDLATRYRTAGGGKGSLGRGESSSASIKTSKFVSNTPPAVGEAATMTAEKITTELGDSSTTTRVSTDDRDDGSNFSVGEPPSSGSSLPLRGRQEQGEATSMHEHYERRRSSSGSNRDNAASALTITREESLRPSISSAEKRDGEGRKAMTTATAFRREEAGDGRRKMVGERVYIDSNRKEQLQQALALAKQRTGVRREGSSSLGALDFDDGGEGDGRGGCERRGRSCGRDRGHGVSRLRRDDKVSFSVRGTGRN